MAYMQHGLQAIGGADKQYGVHAFNNKYYADFVRRLCLQNRRFFLVRQIFVDRILNGADADRNGDSLAAVQRTLLMAADEFITENGFDIFLPIFIQHGKSTKYVLIIVLHSPFPKHTYFIL